MIQIVISTDLKDPNPTEPSGMAEGENSPTSTNLQIQGHSLLLGMWLGSVLTMAKTWHDSCMNSVHPVIPKDWRGKLFSFPWMVSYPLRGASLLFTPAYTTTERLLGMRQICLSTEGVAFKAVQCQFPVSSGGGVILVSSPLASDAGEHVLCIPRNY